MKKLILSFVLSFLVVGGTVNLTLAQSIGGTEAGSCETGGLANVKCPYWDVVYEVDSGFWPFVPPSIKITCTTGGEFVCQN